MANPMDPVHTEEIEATSREDHRRRTGTLQSRKKYHRADFQPTQSLWGISPAPARPLPCLHRLQEGLRQGFACSFVGTMKKYNISTNLIQVRKRTRKLYSPKEDERWYRHTSAFDIKSSSGKRRKIDNNRMKKVAEKRADEKKATKLNQRNFNKEWRHSNDE